MKKVELQGEPTERELRNEELRRARALLDEERRRTRVPRKLGKLAVAGGLLYGGRAIDRNVLKRWGGDRIVRVPGSDRLQSVGGGRRAAYESAARHYGSKAVEALRKRMRFEAVRRLTELAEMIGRERDRMGRFIPPAVNEGGAEAMREAYPVRQKKRKLVPTAIGAAGLVGGALAMRAGLKGMKRASAARGVGSPQAGGMIT